MLTATRRLASIAFTLAVTTMLVLFGCPGAQAMISPGQFNLNTNQNATSRLVHETERRGGKWVALTFDDGPSPVYTPQVLAILRQYNIHATFCMIGQNVARNPQLVREVLADGHRLCDHTMTHDEHLPSRPVDTQRREVVGCLQAIANAAPKATVMYYRAPGGNFSGDIRQLVASFGLQPLSWSVDTRDWSRPGVAAIVSAVKAEVRPGGVILMNDGGGDRSESIAALKIIIPWLISQGYQFDFPATQ